MNPIHTKTLFSRGLALAGVAALATTALVSAEQAKPAAPAAKPATAAPAAEIKYKTNVKGPADAPIKVVEFADFMCPGCQAASGALRSWFAQQGPDVNLTFKNFPLEQSCNPGIGQTVHRGACELARGAICASGLDKANDIIRVQVSNMIFDFRNDRERTLLSVTMFNPAA